MFSLESIAEDAVRIELNNCNENDTPQIIARLKHAIEQHIPNAVSDYLPAYNTLTLITRFPRVLPQDLIHDIRTKILGSLLTDNLFTPARTLYIPAFYDHATGPDLERVAHYNNTDIQNVITQHSTQTFQVYAIGFSPGFAYLGYLPNNLTCPRLDKPRPFVAKGSLGIAGRQTGVYPKDSPGGWNIIGRSPFVFFKPNEEKAEHICPLSIGDGVQFQAVSQREFIRLGGQL
ncbi:MAG: KipI family sensor histidine kinase inhibitor [Flavobacteriales bacterium]